MLFERREELQLYFPQLRYNGLQEMVVEQSITSITLYQGGRLIHTNSVGSLASEGLFCSPSITMGQKQDLYSDRRKVAAEYLALHEFTFSLAV